MACHFSENHNPCFSCLNPCYNNDLTTEVHTYGQVEGINKFLEQNPNAMIQSVSVIKKPNMNYETYFVVYLMKNQG